MSTPSESNLNHTYLSGSLNADKEEFVQHIERKTQFSSNETFLTSLNITVSDDPIHTNVIPVFQDVIISENIDSSLEDPYTSVHKAKLRFRQTYADICQFYSCKRNPAARKVHDIGDIPGIVNHLHDQQATSPILPSGRDIIMFSLLQNFAFKSISDMYVYPDRDAATREKFDDDR